MKRLIIPLILALITISFSSINATDLLDRAKSDYLFKLEKYREAESVFHLKRSQFQTSLTFASQEEAVAAAKELMLNRADVYYTYYQALRIALLETRGVDVTTRDTQTQQLEKWQTFFKDHQQRLADLQVIDDVLAESKIVEDQQDVLNNVTYHDLSILAIAKLQSSTDQLAAFSQKIKDAINVQERNPSVRDSKLRGFIEIDRSLTNSSTAIASAKLELTEFNDKNSNPQRTFEDIQEELLVSHDQVRRAYQLLAELSEGVEL